MLLKKPLRNLRCPMLLAAGLGAHSQTSLKLRNALPDWKNSLIKETGASLVNTPRKNTYSSIVKLKNNMFWAISLSTKQKDFYFNYIDPNDQKVSAILAQMKLVSVKRLKRKLYDIPNELFDEIRQKLKSFL